jgi:hypothetical protein
MQIENSKIEIFITTAKRPKWCLNMIKEVQRESKGFNYNIRVFHDNDGSDYSKVKKYCAKSNNVFYYKTLEFGGKPNFWILHNMMYSVLDTLDYDYFILLVDDMTLVKDFTKRAVRLVNKTIDICNFCTVNVHITNMMSKGFRVINGVEMSQTNWWDCMCVARKKAMQGLRILKPSEHRKKYAGSGVAQEFIRAYNNKSGKKIWQTRFALTEHLGIDNSAMHKRERRFNYYGDVRTDNDPLRMAIAPEDYEYTNTKFNKLWKI